MTMQTDLLAWYYANARQLAFRKNQDPYCIWISEIMAQQTRIEAMLTYYERFMALYPDLPSLAQADDEQLHKAWEGLGYYSRCRNLKKCAVQCMEQYEGRLPATKEELKKLPGIGEYTAGAIASIAYKEKVSAVDGHGTWCTDLYAQKPEMRSVPGWPILPHDRSGKPARQAEKEGKENCPQENLCADGRIQDPYGQKGPGWAAGQYV